MRPQHIITVHRRGYRFIAPVTIIEPAPAPETSHFPPVLPPIGQLPDQRSTLSAPELIVGRESEMEQLQRWWKQALQGTRQTVFVTGEAGIGKATVVEAFVAQVAATGAGWVSHGQCIEQYGAGEAYLPLLEAVGRLEQSSDRARWLELLRRYAPSWLLQLPALISANEAAEVQRRMGNASRERMLCELAEAVERVTAESPLLLMLEDLHWSDVSSVDWLAYQARRREGARLMVIGTYRPVEAIVRSHPVRAVMQELLLHGQCAELALGHLPATGIMRYLAHRFGDGVLPTGLARVLQLRTAGNPLFLVTVVDELVRQRMIRQGPMGWELVGGVDAAVGGMPEGLRQLLDRQVERLPAADQELLEAASVAGTEFSGAVVAAGVERGVEEVEAHYDTLARRGQMVSRCGTDGWPDGTVTARYGFLHDLYREVLYSRVPVSRRMRWHRALARRLEVGYGEQAREMAAELAEHFVRGRDPAPAVLYLQNAAEQAVQRSAHQEARRYLTTALELLATLPDT